MFNFIYYYFYIFYSKKMIQRDPYFVTILAISGSQVFIVITFFRLIYIHFLCEQPGRYYTIGIWGIILFTNFYLITRTRSDEILQAKPNLFNSRSFSVFCAVVFFLFSIVCMFLGPIVSKQWLEQCG